MSTTPSVPVTISGSHTPPHRLQKHGKFYLWFVASVRRSTTAEQIALYKLRIWVKSYTFVLLVVSNDEESGHCSTELVVHSGGGSRPRAIGAMARVAPKIPAYIYVKNKTGLGRSPSMSDWPKSLLAQIFIVHHGIISSLASPRRFAPIPLIASRCCRQDLDAMRPRPRRRTPPWIPLCLSPTFPPPRRGPRHDVGPAPCHPSPACPAWPAAAS